MAQDGPNADALAQRAWAFLTELTAEHSPRASATEQEARAAEYLAAIYRSLGYQTTIQPFEVSVLVTDPPVLRVTHKGESANLTPAPAVDAQPLRLSAQATAGGLLSHVGLVLGDLPAGSVAGKVALIERGLIPFELKVSRVTNAGAVAAVIYNNEPGQFGGTLTTQARIPVVSISQEAGQELFKLASAGDAEVVVTVAYARRQSRNVVAERPGANPSRAVILGGHFDTVSDVPGANDNGSGVATLLAIAEAIKERDYPFTVRFVDFGSEELGLEGSQHYLATLSSEERRTIVAMLNFDALGSGAAGVYGTDDLANQALSVANASGLRLSREANIQGGSSDFASFEAAGTPFLFFLASDFSRIHTLGDTLDRIDQEVLGTAAAVAIGVLDRIPSLGS
ncbi:MAG: M28 family peptidase [Chloroflexi bacterium]|nr:M28 family peptidase [Chloroflexota bacterium]